MQSALLQPTPRYRNGKSVMVPAKSRSGEGESQALEGAKRMMMDYTYSEVFLPPDTPYKVDLPPNTRTLWLRPATSTLLTINVSTHDNGEAMVVLNVVSAA